MSDHLYDKKRLLMEAARAESDPYRASRRLGAIAGMLAGAAAAPAELGCVEGDELGAYGGVADIPLGLETMQQWAGFATQPAQAKALIRVDLPIVYARAWTIQLAAPQVPSGAAVAVPSTNAAIVTVRWGHHGSTDEASFSWPDRGGSFTVFGAFVQVSVTDPTAAATPTANYNAWMTEGTAARTSQPFFQPISSKVVSTSLAPAGAALATFDPRARAFYITAVPANYLAGAPIEMRLQDNLVTRLVVEIDPGFGNGPHDLLEMARTPFFIPPWCNAVLFTNTSADIWDALTIHQVLDLGG